MGDLLGSGGAERGPRAEVCGLMLCALISLLSLLSSPLSTLPFCLCCRCRLCLSAPVSPCESLSSSAFCSCRPPDHNEEAQGEKGGGALGIFFF